MHKMPLSSVCSSPWCLITKSLLLLLILILMYSMAVAQCPMCKASAESSIKEGSKMAEGLNRGILYLLVMPYLLFSVIFFVWYKHHRRNKVSSS